MPRDPSIHRERTNVRRALVRRWKRAMKSQLQKAIRDGAEEDLVELHSPRTEGWISY